jgi:hypothetical protein
MGIVLLRGIPEHVYKFPDFNSASIGLKDTAGWHGKQQDFTFSAFLKVSQVRQGTIFARAKSGVAKGFYLNMRGDGYVYFTPYPTPAGYSDSMGLKPSCVQDLSKYDSNSYGKELTSAHPLFVNQQIHLAFVRQSSAFKLYVNGSLSCEAPFTGMFDDAANVVQPDYATIGAHYKGSSLNQALFPGDISGASIYGTALDNEDIRMLSKRMLPKLSLSLRDSILHRGTISKIGNFIPFVSVINTQFRETGGIFPTNCTAAPTQCEDNGYPNAVCTTRQNPNEGVICAQNCSAGYRKSGIFNHTCQQLGGRR